MANYWWTLPSQILHHSSLFVKEKFKLICKCDRETENVVEMPRFQVQNCPHTVKPRPEAHMDMIHFEVFLKSIDLIPQQQILQRHNLYYR